MVYMRQDVAQSRSQRSLWKNKLFPLPLIAKRCTGWVTRLGVAKGDDFSWSLLAPRKLVTFTENFCTKFKYICNKLESALHFKKNPWKKTSHFV